jgi:hypothetical protein
LGQYGNIEWIPASNSVKKRRLTWERFSEVMIAAGKETRMK